jgi:hypothetical protein
LTIQWATKIPKRQSTADDGGYYSSYASAIVGDHIEIVYNDDPDNLTITNPADVAEYSGVKKSVAVLVQINPDGTWKKDLLFKSKEQGKFSVRKFASRAHQMRCFFMQRKEKITW